MNQNSHAFPPNIDPQLFSWIACIVGSLCVADYTAAEQNSFGNWLILVGQFVLTNAAQMQLIQNRNNQANNQNLGDGIFGDNGLPFENEQNINFLIDAVNRLQKELDNLKNNL